MLDQNKTAIETVKVSLHCEKETLFSNGKTVYPFNPSNSKRSYLFASIGFCIESLLGAKYAACQEILPTRDSY